jgi:hypothetical protein
MFGFSFFWILFPIIVLFEEGSFPLIQTALLAKFKLLVCETRNIYGNIAYHVYSSCWSWLLLQKVTYSPCWLLTRKKYR